MVPQHVSAASRSTRERGKSATSELPFTLPLRCAAAKNDDRRRALRSRVARGRAEQRHPKKVKDKPHRKDP